MKLCRIQRLGQSVQSCLSSSELKTSSVRAMSTVTPECENHTLDARSFSAIPGPKGIYQWPVIGSLLNFKPFTKHTPETIHELLLELSSKYGPVFKVQLGRNLIVLSDPKDFETVYRNEGKYPIKPPSDLFMIYAKRNNAQHKLPLSQQQGADWQALRSPLNKRLMKADSATHYLEQHNEIANEFVDILATKKLTPEELQELFLRYACESISAVVFNSRLGLFKEKPEKDSLDLLEASSTMLNMIIKAFNGGSIAHRWYRNSTYIKFEDSYNLIKRVVLGHVTDARKALEDRIKAGQFKEDEPNLLYSLLSEKSLTNEIVETIMTSLIAAGTDSTAKNIQIFFYILAKNPNKQDILRQEILDYLGKDGPLTAEALSKMVYLKAALKESFRLMFPLSGGNLRVLPVEVTLGGYKVPAGVPVLLFNQKPLKTHFENPYQYIPERWLKTEEAVRKEPSENMIVLPFGFGPRNCIGRRLAVQEIYVATVKVLQCLKIDIDPASLGTKFIYRSFLEPEKPLKFKFTKID